MWATIKQYWHFAVIGVLVLVVIGMSAFSGSTKTPASANQQLSQAQQQAPASATTPAAMPPCPAVYDCKKKETVEEKLDRLLAAQAAQQAPAPAAPATAAPASGTTPASSAGSDPAVKYTGRKCTRVAKRPGESTTGFEGYGPGGRLGCWRI